MLQACNNLHKYGFPTNCPEIQLTLSCNNLHTNSFTNKLHRSSVKGVNHIYETIYVRAVLRINYTEIKLKIVF